MFRNKCCISAAWSRLSPHQARLLPKYTRNRACALALGSLPHCVLLSCPQVNWLNKILHGYLKYDLPLWLTEFACGDEPDKMNASAQASYLSSALKLLELHPSVARYAW